MKTKKNDNNSFAPYKGDPEVEAVVNKAYFDFVKLLMDKALDDKMWIDNPEEFHRLLSIYNEAKNICEIS